MLLEIRKNQSFFSIVKEIIAYQPTMSVSSSRTDESIDSMTVGHEPDIESDIESDEEDSVEDYYQSCDDYKDENDGFIHNSYVTENPDKPGAILEKKASIPFKGVPLDLSVAAPAHDFIAEDKR